MRPLVPFVLALPAVQADFLDLDYRVRLSVADPAEELVRVDAELSGLSGPLELGFASKSSYVSLEPRLVLEPRATDPEGEPLALERLDPYRWLLDPGEADRALLDWTVRLDHRRHPDVVGRDEYEQPYLREDHGVLTCATTLLVPRTVYLEDRLDATVSFALPPGWAVEAPWPERSPNVFVPPDVSGLATDLIAIGAWDRLRTVVNGVDLSVVFAPGQESLKEAIAEPLAKIVEAELELFGLQPHERYLFLFVEPDQALGYGGSIKPNSMTLFLSSDLPVDFARDELRHLLAHEYHHTWMIARCQPEDELRFVMEGFTDWYAALVPWRIGEVDDASFHARVLEQFSRADAALAELEGSLAEAGGDAFFEGGAAYDACYRVGFALAAWTELALREAKVGYGLDELLRRFYNDPRWDEGLRPTPEDWFALVAEGIGEELAERQRAGVFGEDGFDWVELFELVGLRLEREVQPLDPTPRANFEGNRVTAIDPAGAGYRVGLREGDLLLEVSGRPVVDARTAQGNWRADEQGRIAVVLERGGERLEFAVEYPAKAVYRFAEGQPELPWG